MRVAALIACLIAAPALADPVYVAAVDPDTEVAQRHFLAGLEHYKMGRYVEALGEFGYAKKVRPSPALDFNIARCLDRLERWSEAAEAYEKYAARLPSTDPDGREARDRAKTMRERAAELATPTPSVPAVVVVKTSPPAVPKTSPSHVAIVKPVDVSPPPSRRRWWIGGAVAGVAVVGGVAVGLAVGLRGDKSVLPPTTEGHFETRWP